MSAMEKHYSKKKKAIRQARHQSKPDADNTTVVTDHDGNWLFEIYSPPKKTD